MWEGEMVERSESLLLVKTPPGAARTIIEAIKSDHPYDVPSILCVACCDGDTDYLNWLNYRN
jgi:periplasmic divalent cation tolerance protein